MNEDIYAEWLIKRKDPAYRIPAIIALGAAAVASFVLMITKAWGFVVFIVVLVGAWFIFRYLRIEYEYVFVTSELSIDKIYSGQSRKNAMKIDMSKVEYVEPTNRDRNTNLLAGKTKILADYSSHNKDAQTYTISYSDNGKSYLVIFEPNDKVLHAMWRCSPSKVTMRK